MLTKAAQFIKEAKVIIVTTGAGMGKDSGLPDFRGNQGFWNNYPPYKNKFNFYDCANPSFLKQHPHLFWGFYGHRLQMYRSKQPHKGYHLLKEMASTIADPADNKDNLFAITSNVDGHFLKAKYPQNRIYQVHGSINHLQCYNCQTISPNTFQPEVDEQTMSCKNLPTCPKCKQPVRPNILMFGDWEWLQERSSYQETEFQNFINQKKKHPKVLIEIGAGQVVPTIRNITKNMFYKHPNLKVIRINPDPTTNSPSWDQNRYVHFSLSALEALQNLKQLL